MYIGVDYYPEHWSRRRWRRDIELMRKAGFNVVRMAEFAWTFMEPEEGVYDFSLFDEVLELLERNGMSAVMGTPTAGMPAWVARKYPETLAVGADGNRIVFGARKNNCFTSGTYRLLSERVTGAMARHFSQKSNLIGWQTDNEFRWPVCHCDNCRNEWRDWLRRKYGALEAVNAAWGTHFWGHTARRWDEIVIPVDRMRHNPSACLDWQRFYSWINVRFQHDQVKILRKYSPGRFLLHNCILGPYVDPEVNCHHLAEDLDFIGWDNYPVLGKPEISYYSSFTADLVRGMKDKNFWVMEQTAGAPGDGCFYRNPRPGEIRKIAYQQLARGGDNQMWFRWRTCTAGREQYWHGLLGHDGKPLRRYLEAAQTSREFHQLASALEDTTPRPEVALLYDYDSLWAIRIQPGFENNHYRRALLLYYNALFRAGVNVSVIRPEDNFAKYKAVLAPDLNILPDDLAGRLNAYAKTGGVLLADCRTGVKNETNLCHERTLPGLLGESLGIKIEEYEAVLDDVRYPLRGQRELKGAFTAEHYMDWVKPGKAEVLANYDQWHLRPYAAVTRNSCGKGTAYYVGTRVREEAFYDALIADILKHAKVKAPVRPPKGVEVSLRQGKNKKLLFLINHMEEKKTVAVPAGKRELLSDSKTKSTIVLDPYDVAVVEL